RGDHRHARSAVRRLRGRAPAGGAFRRLRHPRRLRRQNRGGPGFSYGYRAAPALTTSLAYSLNVRVAPLGRLQAWGRLARVRVKSVAAGVEVGEDRGPHARVPELPDVRGRAGHGLIRPLAREEFADLVRHVDELVTRPFRRHGRRSLWKRVAGA